MQESTMRSRVRRGRNERGGISVRMMIGLAIVGYLGFLASDWVGSWVQYYRVNSAVRDIARFSKSYSEEQIRERIRKSCKDLGVQMNESSYKFFREPYDQSKVQIDFTYPRKVDLRHKHYDKVFEVSIYEGLPMFED